MKVISRASVPDEERWRIYNKIAGKILPLIVLGYTIASIDRMNVAFAKLQMSADIGLSETMYGFGAGIFFVGYCLFEIPSNMILHKVGARMWLARIMIMWGVLSAGMMFVQTPSQFYVLRFLLGITEAGFYPGALLFLTYWFPRYARGQAVSIMLLGTSLAAIVGGPLAGGIMGFMDDLAGLRGWQWLFLVEGVPATLLGIVVLIVLRNGPHDAGWLNAGEKEIVTADLSAEAEAQAQQGTGRHRFADAFRNPNIWCLVLANFCNLCTLYGIQFWLPTIIQRVSQTAVFATGLIAAGLAILPCAVLILNARHSDRTGERRWHAAGGFLLSLVGLTIAGSFSENPYLVLSGLVLGQCGVAAASATIFALPATFVLGAAAAAGFAFITTIGNFAGYASPYLIGVLRDATGGFSAAFYGLAMVAFIGALFILATPALRRPADAKGKVRQPAADLAGS
ncbi:MAG TPA: MFS transporter [Sphingomonadaceae bacterium]|nr:MFS transporter [Sphingomonadaceae bacterium]